MSDFIQQVEVPQHIANIAVPEERPTTGGGGTRQMITNPVDGSQIARSDYMKALAANGWTRPQIVKHFHKVIGDESVRYQTVHQACKEYYTKDDPESEVKDADGGDTDTDTDTPA